MLYLVFYRCVYRRSIGIYRCILTYKVYFFDQCGGFNNLMGDIIFYYYCVVEIGLGFYYRLEAF